MAASPQAMQDDDKPEGEDMDLPGDDPGDVEDTPDGGAIVTMTETSIKEEKEFYRNLAEDCDPRVLQSIALDLLQKIEYDKDARSKRDKQYEEGIRRTGMGKDAPGGATFEGASDVVHPMLTQAYVDFEARTIKELFPSTGVVKHYIPGKTTKERLDKARRKTDFFNWQLTTQMPEFRSTLETVLIQVPAGGAQYLRLVWNDRQKRPKSSFVGVDQVYLPFAATAFYDAERITLVDDITQFEYDQRVASGFYRQVDGAMAPSALMPEQSATQKANDKVEGREDPAYNEDGLRRTYEVNTFLDNFDDDEADKDLGPMPYLVCLDESSHEVLAVIRNWEKTDKQAERMHWLIQFPMIPWRGAYPIGLIHMIGGLSAAATGALRALLDSAHVNNVPTAAIMKGAGLGGQNLSLQPGTLMEVKAPMNIDDIRKVIMAIPFNQTSPTLYSLLGFLVEAGQAVVRTTFDDMAQAKQDAPVGTTLALIEQGLTVMSAIHMRLHAAMAMVLKVLHRIDRMYMDEDDIKDEMGESLITRAELAGPLDVIPVSDPNIFSDAQRFAQVQAIANRADLKPGLYDQHKVEKLILERMKIPNAEDLLIPVPMPQLMNAANENMAMSMGRPVVAFPQQDDLAHIQTHLGFFESPMLGQSPLISKSFTPGLLSHLKEHVCYWYVKHVFNIANASAQQVDPSADIGEMLKIQDPQVNQMLDQLIAQASITVVQDALKAFEKVPPVIQQAMQLMQQFADAAMAGNPQIALEKQALDVEQKKTDATTNIKMLQLKQEDAQNKTADQLAAQKLAAQTQQHQDTHASNMQKESVQQQGENVRTAAELQVRTATNTQDNMTSLEIANKQAEAAQMVAETRASKPPASST